MIVSDFVFKSAQTISSQGEFIWQAPSNIAIVKYWGKFGQQQPKNTSLSFTLKEAFTKTRLKYAPKEQQKSDIQLYLDQELRTDFLPKIQNFLNLISPYCPFVDQLDFSIETHNSFPHSSGIASSASAFAALALGVMSIEKSLNEDMSAAYFYKKAAFLARLGSGSATRSIKGSHMLWGKHQDITESSDFYGIDISPKAHTVFKNFQDTILLVDKGQKQVSSTVGHSLMNKHPFAEKRFEQAQDNIKSLMPILQAGDVEAFINILETEALSLHAMMMTAQPYFILMQPQTLNIIHKIWDFRKQTQLPVGFTLDAGANVHMLYPESDIDPIKSFIKTDLVPLCENNQYICDRVGVGAMEIA